MDERKKQKLVEQGWRVGDASDFLDLSPEETAYIELKLLLSEQLKQHRQQRQLTQAALGKLLRSSQSRVAKMEACDSSVSLDLLIRALFALGVSRSDLARLLAPRQPAVAT